MDFQTINSVLITLWDMLHIYLPLFILIGVFQTAVSMYGFKNLLFTRENLNHKEESFLHSLDDFNERSSDIVLVLAFIGTVFGMILALFSLSEAWGVTSAESSQAGLRGAAIALTSTLGGLFFARLWGQHINDAILQKVFDKYKIERVGEESKHIKQVTEKNSQQMGELVTLLKAQNEMLKSLLRDKTDPSTKSEKEAIINKSGLSSLDDGREQEESNVEEKTEVVI